MPPLGFIKVKKSAGRWLQAVALAAAVCVSLSATDSTERFNKLGGKLMCTCGCAQMLMGCDHVGCPSRGEEMDRLRTGIAGGMDDKAILAGFVQEYGEVVLAAPPAEGFNILAWIMPFAVAALALIGTILLVRHWARQQPKLGPVKMTAVQMQGEQAMRERIRRETGADGDL